MKTSGECQRALNLTAMPQLSREASSVKEDIAPIDGSSRHRWGLVVTGFVGGTLVALYAIATPFVTPAFRKVCLPFVPATPAQINNVLKLLRYRTGKLVDIGSGDGRIVIAAAKQGFQAVGFELNPWLVWYSKYRAWREGVHHNTAFYRTDLWKLWEDPGYVEAISAAFTDRDVWSKQQRTIWKVNFSQYSNIVIFGVPQMMVPLENKLQLDLSGAARVVACRFPFPTWEPDAVAGEGIDAAWAYDSKSFREPRAAMGAAKGCGDLKS